MHIGPIAQITYNFATTAAIAVGGVWAYFKFLRGRTFSRRVELSVVPCIEERYDWLYFSIAVKIKNSGLSKLTLNEDMKYLQLYGMQYSSDASPAIAEWQRLLVAKIYDQHRFVEAQEEITDTIALRLRRSPNYQAYKIEAWLGSPLNKLTRKGNLWHARSIVFAPVDPTGQACSISNGNVNLIRRVLRQKGKQIEQS